MKKAGFAGLASAYCAIGILLFALMNYLFSPQTPWCIFTTFALLWVPLSAWLCGRRAYKAYAVAGSALTAAFLAAVNLIYSPEHIWFLYTLYPLLWWPLSMFFNRSDSYKALSIPGSLLTVAYFVVVNMVSSPDTHWFWYACFPVLWWPVAVYLGRRAGTIGFALLCSAITAAYYTALNLLLSPGFPWAIFITFALLWWPATMLCAHRHAWFAYSLFGGVWVLAFFTVTNLITSPGVAWAFYPVFAVLWWPLAVFCAKKHAWLAFSLTGSALIIAFLTAVNVITSPGVPWAFYPAFAVLWWPLAVLSAKKHAWLAFSLAGSALFSLFILAVNYVTSPGVLWAAYPIFAVLWWPLALYFFSHRKKKLAARTNET